MAANPPDPPTDPSGTSAGTDDTPTSDTAANTPQDDEPKSSELKKVPQGQLLDVENIYFQGGAYSLKGELSTGNPTQTLDKVVKLMKDNSDMRIEVSGHTGPPSFKTSLEFLRLEILSQNRADAIRDYLTEKGIKGNRITTIGHGHNYPIRTGGSSRRVEFKVL